MQVLRYFDASKFGKMIIKIYGPVGILDKRFHYRFSMCIPNVIQLIIVLILQVTILFSDWQSAAHER